MTIAYLAGPLFTMAERRFNEELATAVTTRCKTMEIILPQRIAAEAASKHDFASRMFGIAMNGLDRCDAVIAILDGADSDSGTCVELGYAYAHGKTIIGIRTDLRESEDRGLNLMVSQLCSTLILKPSTTTSVEELADEIARAFTQ
jgi:nucleoside 2-deoxyribosyltransferase